MHVRPRIQLTFSRHDAGVEVGWDMGNEHKGCVNTGSTGTGSTGILPVHSMNRQDACSPSGEVHLTNRQDACSPSEGLSDHFMRPYEDIDIHARNLPHWSQDNILVFATWRLKDSLPRAKLQEIEENQKAFLSGHPEPWSEEILRLYRKKVSCEMEDFLDSGRGSCVLKDENIRKEVENAMHFFDGKRYRLHAFVVMPNHVHVLFELLLGYPQTKVLHSWKSFTATVINKALGRQGQLWQDESWDRLIRNENHYRNCLEYIQNNNVRLARILVDVTGSTGTGSTGILPVHSTNRQDACSPSGEPSQKT